MAAKRAALTLRRNNPDVAAYIARLEADHVPLVRELRSLVRREVPDVREGLYWAVPFFFRRSGIAYISPAKRHVTFGIVNGVQVKDKFGLLSGTGNSPIRKATLRYGEPIPEEAIVEWLRQAVAIDETIEPDEE